MRGTVLTVTHIESRPVCRSAFSIQRSDFPKATRPGLEPGTRGPKPLVLPLHHRVIANPPPGRPCGPRATVSVSIRMSRSQTRREARAFHREAGRPATDLSVRTPRAIGQHPAVATPGTAHFTASRPTLS